MTGERSVRALSAGAALLASALAVLVLRHETALSTGVAIVYALALGGLVAAHRAGARIAVDEATWNRAAGLLVGVVGLTLMIRPAPVQLQAAVTTAWLHAGLTAACFGGRRHLPPWIFGALMAVAATAYGHAAG